MSQFFLGRWNWRRVNNTCGRNTLHYIFMLKIVCGCIKLKHGWYCNKEKESGLSSTKVCWKDQLIIHFMEEENDQDIINDVARAVGVLWDKNRTPRGPTQDRNVRKEQWTELYNEKSEDEFSEKMQINRTTFNLLLNTLWDGLVLTPTNSVLEPTSPDTQLAATLYRLAHRVHTPSWKTFLGFRKNRDAYFSTR